MKIFLLSIFVLSALLSLGVSAAHAKPKHFFTQDSCQSWELKDDTTGVVDSFYFLRTDNGVQFKQGFQKNKKNSFYQSVNLINQTETIINHYSDSFVVCETRKLTDDEVQAITLLSQKWNEMKENPVFQKSKNGEKRWLYEGVKFIGDNHTNVQYTEEDGTPNHLKIYDADGKLDRQLTVTHFDSSCDKVSEIFEDDVTNCEIARQQGSGFPQSAERKRGTPSLRIPQEQFDTSKPRFAAQKPIIEGKQRAIERTTTISERRDEEYKCTFEGAMDALLRAIQTKSMEYGNWCGVGSEKGTCCETVCPDGGYDNFCRKHDSSTYSISLVGVTISPCACDKEFLDSSIAFDGCEGGPNAAWRVDPDRTGKETCQQTKDAAVNTFKCMPCINYECEGHKWDYFDWRSKSQCDWEMYFTEYPEHMACDGECWNSTMKPFDYDHWYDNPPNCD